MEHTWCTWTWECAVILIAPAVGPRWLSGLRTKPRHSYPARWSFRKVRKPCGKTIACPWCLWVPRYPSWQRWLRLWKMRSGSWSWSTAGWGSSRWKSWGSESAGALVDMQRAGAQGRQGSSWSTERSAEPHRVEMVGPFAQQLWTDTKSEPATSTETQGAFWDTLCLDETVMWHKDYKSLCQLFQFISCFLYMMITTVSHSG